MIRTVYPSETGILRIVIGHFSRFMNFITWAKICQFQFPNGRTFQKNFNEFPTVRIGDFDRELLLIRICSIFLRLLQKVAFKT